MFTKTFWQFCIVFVVVVVSALASVLVVGKWSADQVQIANENCTVSDSEIC